MCNTPSSVLDHVAHGLVVALDKAGHNFALKAAVFTLFDDSLADDEFQQDSLFTHSRLAKALGD